MSEFVIASEVRVRGLAYGAVLGEGRFFVGDATGSELWGEGSG